MPTSADHTTARSKPWADHTRTTRPHAGQSMKDTVNKPGPALLFIALVAVVACLAASGTSHGDIGTGLTVIAAVMFVACGLWFGPER
jgi:hypothetical protein